MEIKQIRKFPEGLLQHVSKTIANYRSGSGISELLRNAGFPEKSVITGTKWRVLYDVFLEFNVRPVTRKHIVKVIETFCAPTQWIGQSDEYLKVLDTLNEGLIHVKMQLTKKGRIKATIIRSTFSNIQPIYSDSTKQTTSAFVPPAFKVREIESENDLCFVLMPFKPSFKRLYKDKIKPSVEACGLRCFKADDLFSPTPILEDIIVYIKKSKLIIADVTERNANVFYEMGIAHTLGKPVIIITQDKNDIPFDIAQIRYFHYSDDVSGWDTLCKNITLSINSVTGTS